MVLMKWLLWSCNNRQGDDTFLDENGAVALHFFEVSATASDWVLVHLAAHVSI